MFVIMSYVHTYPVADRFQPPALPPPSPAATPKRCPASPALLPLPLKPQSNWGPYLPACGPTCLHPCTPVSSTHNLPSLPRPSIPQSDGFPYLPAWPHRPMTARVPTPILPFPVLPSPSPTGPPTCPPAALPACLHPWTPVS